MLLDRGRLYLNVPNSSGGTGRLTALDATTGAVRWTGHDGAQPVAVAGGTGTLLASRGTTLFAIDPATGHRIWTRTGALPANAYGPVAVGGGRVYLRCASKLGPTCTSSLSVGGLTLLRGRLLAAMACDSGYSGYSGYSSTLYTIDTGTGS